MKDRVRAGAGLQRRYVTRGASDCREHLLPRPDFVVYPPAPYRREQPHEAGEVIDAAAAREWIADVLGIGKPIADAHLRRRHTEGRFFRKDVVGDAHLVAIGVGPEGEER